MGQFKRAGRCKQVGAAGGAVGRNKSERYTGGGSGLGKQVGLADGGQQVLKVQCAHKCLSKPNAF